MQEKEIIRKLRKKLREYFPNIQNLIDQRIITRNDWIFFGLLQLKLVKCFLDTPEKNIRKSKLQLKNILKFYDLELRARKSVLKSITFDLDNKIDKNEINAQIDTYSEHKNYWLKRKQSKEIYFNYELFLFLYFKWMNNYEFEIENTIKLVLDIMEMTNFYKIKYYSFERIKYEREILLDYMKISGHLLVNNSNYFSSIFDKGINLSSIDLNNFIKEINAHL